MLTHYPELQLHFIDRFAVEPQNRITSFNGRFKTIMDTSIMCTKLARQGKLDKKKEPDLVVRGGGDEDGAATTIPTQAPFPATAHHHHHQKLLLI